MKEHFSLKLRSENLSIFFRAYNIKMLIVAALCPLFLVIPASILYLSIIEKSFLLTLLSFLLLVPWLFIPTAYTLHLFNYTKKGKIAASILLGWLVVTFVVWTVLVSSYRFF